MIFKPVTDLSEVAQHILEKRYFHEGETTWKQVVDRVIKHVFVKNSKEDAILTGDMILNRYFVPNSPCLVNAGKEKAGLLACFVLPFEDTIEDIYKTKLNFALIAKRGGGCGTTLSHLRPKGSVVSGSVHGYAGGPVAFYDTICKDMEVITQAGFRAMAMLGSISVYHPDIEEFILAKETEGKMTTTNISVLVDDAFMNKVKNDETYWTEFDGKKYQELKARDIFNLLVEGAWRNGEPGILFYDRINDSLYKYSNQNIETCNPCGEQPLPFFGSCNLGNLDISKFLNEDKSINLELLELAVRLGIRFLDAVIDTNTFPIPEIEEFALKNRPVGLGKPQ